MVYLKEGNQGGVDMALTWVWNCKPMPVRFRLLWDRHREHHRKDRNQEGRHREHHRSRKGHHPVRHLEWRGELLVALLAEWESTKRRESGR